MAKEYNNQNQYMTRFRAIRRTNSKVGWVNSESEWISDEYYIDMYNYYN